MFYSLLLFKIMSSILDPSSMHNFVSNFEIQPSMTFCTCVVYFLFEFLQLFCILLYLRIFVVYLAAEVGVGAERTFQLT